MLQAGPASPPVQSYDRRTADRARALSRTQDIKTTRLFCTEGGTRYPSAELAKMPTIQADRDSFQGANSTTLRQADEPSQHRATIRGPNASPTVEQLRRKLDRVILAEAWEAVKAIRDVSCRQSATRPGRECGRHRCPPQREAIAAGFLGLARQHVGAKMWTSLGTSIG
jgi:hypothetical protein